jgi:hypothetical protein
MRAAPEDHQMSNSLFDVTEAMPACEVLDASKRYTFLPGDRLLASDEQAQGHRQGIVKFKKAGPPQEGLPWPLYYVTQAVFESSTKPMPPMTGPAYIRRGKRRSG